MFFSIDIQGYMCHRIIQQDWFREDEVECAARGKLMLARHLQMHNSVYKKENGKQTQPGASVHRAH